MIKLKDIIKEGVIEPLLEAETYKLKKKDGGKVVKTGEKVAKRKKKIGIQIKGFGKARRG